MKKKLVIIGYNKYNIETYHEQIKSSFFDNIFIENYCIDNIYIKNGIQADLILISSYSVFKLIKQYIKNESDIIIASRTISKESFEEIKNIPMNSKCVLIDETLEMAEQMISVIYELGVKHLDIKASDGNLISNTSGEEFIIKFGKPITSPLFQKKIINIGDELLDVNTIIDIGAKLDLMPILQRQDVRKSYREIVTANFGLANVIGQTNRFESELDILLQVLDDGIIGTNPEGIICTCNDSAENIIGYRKSEIMGQHGSKVLSSIPFEHVLENLESIKEKLIKLNGYDVVISVDPIIHSDKLYGAVATIRKFNDIEKKQHNLRAQLIGKGHKAKYSFEDILGESEVIKKSKDIAKRMAKSDSSILIIGESGTGKELFAQAIHNESKRKKYQFVAVNCGALPESLLESELFGYEEGAFTGAKKGGKPGLFELAHNGTLFLDEIGEMPLSLQMRLLRVLQEREVMRIGGDRLIKVNVRIIAATNRNLKEMVRKGEFREDLYYRVNVLPLKIPSLRVHKEDIFLIINEIKKRYNSDFNLTPRAMEALLSHSWRGNIRELKNYIEYFANLGLRDIDIDDLPFNDEDNLIEDIFSLEEKEVIEEFLEYIGDKQKRYIFVLEQLEKSYNNKIRLGRRSIYEIAQDKGIFISEQEIRTVLINLEKFSLVKINKGRSGSVITDLGKKMLKYSRMG